MLVRFVLSNFLSFDEETEFNMIAGSFKTHKHHVYKAGKIDVLKATAIYGANGAGKSNLVLAFNFLKEMVSEGRINNPAHSYKFKLNKASSEKPSAFEIEVAVGAKIYIYGIKIQNQSVTEEWLYEAGISSEDKLIFERRQTKSGKPSIKMAGKFTRNQKSKLLIELMKENLLKHNELLLGKADTLKIKEISLVHDWIQNNLVIIFPGAKFKGLVQSMYSTPFKKFANDLLQTLDTGIAELDLETIPFDKFFGDDEEELKKKLIELLDESGEEQFIFLTEQNVLVMREGERNVVKRIISIHRDQANDKIPFELGEESDGTRRLLDFIPAFDIILNKDVTVIIDEIDQSLHPSLLQTLAHKIMSDDTTKGQLIFTTHESNLLDLDIFRQDEVWFAEKDRAKGSTQLYSLNEFKPRYDLDIRKGYLKGRFGAIPFVASLNDLKWNEANA